MSEYPLRTDVERLEFCDAYFHSVGAQCPVQRDMYREFVLPRDVDKELTDRPFYWLWVEKTHQAVEPTTLRLAFSEEAKRREDARLADEHRQMLQSQKQPTGYDLMYRKPQQTERVDLGCFRLDRIFTSVQNRGRFICACPVSAPGDATHVPWVMLNGVIQQMADSVSEQWFSVGVCLVNLQIENQFMERISRIDMRSCSPTSILRRTSHSALEGARKAQTHIENQVRSGRHKWAEEAQTRLVDDLAQLDTYYESIAMEDDVESQQAIQLEHERKRAALIETSTPRIFINVTQVGLIGLPLLK